LVRIAILRAGKPGGGESGYNAMAAKLPLSFSLYIPPHNLALGATKKKKKKK
jgi:hypothetical protein